MCSSKYRARIYQQGMTWSAPCGGTSVLAPSIYSGEAVHTSDGFFLLCSVEDSSLRLNSGFTELHNKKKLK